MISILIYELRNEDRRTELQLYGQTRVRDNSSVPR